MMSQAGQGTTELAMQRLGIYHRDRLRNSRKVGINQEKDPTAAGNDSLFKTLQVLTSLDALVRYILSIGQNFDF